MDRTSGDSVITTVLQTDLAVELVLEGELAIASAAELKQELGNVLGSQKSISISLARASALDITAVQLLRAAAQQARSEGRQFKFAEPVPAAIVEMLNESGISFSSILGGEL